MCSSALMVLCLIYRRHNSVSEATKGSVHESGAYQPVQGTSREQSFGMSAFHTHIL